MEMIAIDNAEIVVRYIIGADCTFSHNERHKVIKGYLEVDNKGSNIDDADAWMRLPKSYQKGVK